MYTGDPLRCFRITAIFCGQVFKHGDACILLSNTIVNYVTLDVCQYAQKICDLVCVKIISLFIQVTEKKIQYIFMKS